MTPLRPELDAAAVAALAAEIDGLVIKPPDDAYGDARRVWNGMIDRYPALIITCRSAADVRAAVRFARANGLDISVRVGGHNVAGKSVRDGALMIDLGPMHGVWADPYRKRARAQGGVRP